MKSLITYYSFSGNTDKIANIFGKILEDKGAVDIQRLKPQNEITTFMAQCTAARKHESAVLGDNVKFDASPYDLILIGSPVWAFAPTPAMNTFLDKISGLKGKRVVVLLTSGSGLGVNACFKNIHKILEAKGASRIDEINIPDRKNKDGDFVTSSLQKIL
jgi:flavodoxin